MKERSYISVRDVMKTSFDMVDGMDTVQTALQKMQHVQNKCLIVKKRDKCDEVGMLLISDIGRHVLAKNRSPERVNVYEIMAKPVVSVDVNMNIKYCARLFNRFSLSRAPVMENGEVVGIVSFTDLVLKGLSKE
ncbi:MAG: CBS domain-containing protein [Proteobacteria bacterium]|nr:CBS domain-containing protein [Pseudomonadota bacterium]